MEDTISKLLKAVFGSTMVIALIVLLIVTNIYIWYNQIMWAEKPEIYHYFWWCWDIETSERKFVSWQTWIVFVETESTAQFRELQRFVAERESCNISEDIHFSIQNIKSLRLWN